MSANQRFIVGCMTGTSLDAIDAALVRIEGEGLAMKTTFVQGATYSLGSLREPLRALAQQEPATAGMIATLARDFSLLHAEAIRQLLSRSENAKPTLICVHGQTVFHQPPNSWQLFEPWPLALALNTPVVCNLRQADLAAGGQGAPITPIADVVLYGDAVKTTCVVNLGGFINFTCIPKHTLVDVPAPLSAVRSFQAANLSGADVCACNQLLDGVARIMLRASYDKGGDAALTGAIHEEALEDLEGVLRTQAHSRRSLGTGDELLECINRWRHLINGPDLARTACEAIASTLDERMRSLEQHPSTMILAGGGVHNRALVNSIRANCTADVVTSESIGIPSAFREAACFAVLGALAQDGVPITLPQVTKRTDSLTGKDGVWVFP